MEKHNQMMNDQSIWSYARAQQIGERRYENIKNDCYNEGKAEGYCDVLLHQIKLKYQVDASDWLSTLSKEDLMNVSNAIFDASTYDELKRGI